MQKKLLIFGNSGSGKSSLAKHISTSENIAYLDLDNYAWLKTNPPQRAPLHESFKQLQEFMRINPNWVIEGCYTDLLNLLAPQANEIIYLNLPIKLCIENAKNRPWEAHKYDSKQAQDKNLPMLLAWIEQYDNRDDVFSKKAHTDFYQNFTGKKSMLLSNSELNNHSQN